MLKRINGWTISPTDYYSHCFQVRQNELNIIMKGRRLTQQYAMNAQAKIEYSGLTWAQKIITKQPCEQKNTKDTMMQSLKEMK